MFPTLREGNAILCSSLRRSFSFLVSSHAALLLLLASTVRSGGHPILESQDGRQHGSGREVTQGPFRLLSLKDIVMEATEAGFWFQPSYYLCSLKHMVTLNGPQFLHLESTELVVRSSQ